MANDIETIKQAFPIVDTIGTYVKLVPRGKYLKAPCPFHNERTPSFVVTPERGMYHCFGCGKGGDVISFIQEIEGLSFYDALTFLADKAGITLSHTIAPKDPHKDRVYQVLDEAARFYEVHLRRDKEVVDYLTHRGLTKETLIEFRVGYAPAGWDTLSAHLLKKGYTSELIKKAGLATSGKKGDIDQFRDRIMFPILDPSGRVVAFTGRIFIRPHEEANPPEFKVNTGKYVNSPETDQYNKSRILFGYDKAKSAMREASRAIVTEGQVDCLMAHQTGTKETVALSGTALTKDQVGLLGRFTDHVLLALDNDTAGISAMYKSALLLYQAGITTSVVVLPAGEDPASFIAQKGIDAWKKALVDAQDFLGFVLNLVQPTLKKPAGMQHAEKKLFPLVRAMSLAADQDVALRKIGHALDVSEEAIRADFTRFQNTESEPRQNIPEQPQSKPTKSVREQFAETLFAILWSQEALKQPLIDVRQLENRLKKLFGDSYEIYRDHLTIDRNRLVFEADMRYHKLSSSGLVQEVDDLLLEFEKEQLTEQLSKTRSLIVEAERAKDEETAARLVAEYNRLSQQLHTITQSS